MNNINLIGNLTRDPELTETSSGISICRFSIAVSRSYASGDGERKTDFFDCVAWRGLGETIARYFRKGNKIGVVGSVETDSFEGSDGVRRKTFKIVVKDFDFLTPKQRDEEDDYEPPTRGGRKPELQPFDDDDDIPF